MRTVIAGCAAVLMILAVGAGAGIEHTILHGAKVGQVHVWLGPDELPGLSRKQLQSQAESQLRNAGIEMTASAPSRLEISVRVFTQTDCFADVRSSLVEDALLERNGMRVHAESWRTGGTILQGPVSECVAHIPDAVEGAVGDFIETYGAMNPSAD